MTLEAEEVVLIGVDKEESVAIKNICRTWVLLDVLSCPTSERGLRP